MTKFCSTLWNDAAGQGLVEYVLRLALVAMGLIAIILLFRNSIGGIFKVIKSNLDSAPANSYT